MNRSRLGRSAGESLAVSEPVAAAPHMAKPKLLFLSHALPYPPSSGAAIRTYNVLRQLAAAFDVTALCFYRVKAHGSAAQVSASLAALSGIARVEAFPIPQEHSRLRFLWDHLRSLASGRAYTRFAYDARPYRRRLLELLRSERFDIVHVDSSDLSAYLPLLDRVPVACTHHNVESELLRRRAQNGTGLRSWYLRLQAALTESEEMRWCRSAAINVAVSDADRDGLLRIAPGARITVAPNGVDIAEYVPLDGTDELIAYLGGTEWFPNLDALEYFCGEILPILRRDGRSVPVRWIGRASPEQIAHYRARHSVELTGYVDDVRPWVRDAFCTIVPLRIGGGTRLKITTAWAMGKAVVSTSVGCEGLHAVDGENILIRDDPGSFAEAIRQVMVDPRLRRRLGANGRRTVEQLYSWDVVGRALVREYLEVLGWPEHLVAAGTGVAVDTSATHGSGGEPLRTRDGST
ncbi:MAG TPA: glycosyltransferase family 4 protein [Longimicrobiales bacterium]